VVGIFALVAPMPAGKPRTDGFPVDHLLFQRLVDTMETPSIEREGEVTLAARAVGMPFLGQALGDLDM